MAKQSLKYSESSLNPSLNSYDILTECLTKAHALAHVALSEHFAQSEYNVVHGYLSTLEDLILHVKEAFDEVWHELESRSVFELVQR